MATHRSLRLLVAGYLATSIVAGACARGNADPDDDEPSGGGGGAGGTDGGDAGADGPGGGGALDGGGGAGASGGGGACAPPMFDCDGNAANGCETDVSKSLNHCGACGTACAGGPNQAPTCLGGTCSIACLSSYADCDGSSANGCEVDTSDDLAHCGACDAPCPTLNCSSGACVTGTLASGQNAAVQVVVDGDQVYWSNFGTGNLDGSLMRAPLAGGAAITLVPGLSGTVGVLVLGADVYFTELDGGNVSRTAKAGGGPVDVLASGEPEPSYLATNGTSLYWTAHGTAPDYLDGSIRSLFLAGGSPITLAGGETAPLGIGVSPTHLYWTSLGSGAPGTGALRRMPLGGGAVETLAAGLDYPWGLALDATHAYWTEVSSGLVRRIPLNGGAVQPVATNLSTPYALTVGPSHVYFTDFGDAPGAGSVGRVPLAGGATTLYETAESSPFGVTLGPGLLLWANYGEPGASDGAVRMTLP